MAKLQHLPTLGLKLAGLGGMQKKLPVAHVDRTAEKIVPPAAQAPYLSGWELWLDSWLRRKDPYWQYGGQLGGWRMPGSTTADWINTNLRIALYLDGWFMHRTTMGANRDQLVRAGWWGRGYRVVSWDVASFEELMSRVAELYGRTIG